MLIINHLSKHYKGSGKGVTDVSIHVEKGISMLLLVTMEQERQPL